MREQRWNMVKKQVQYSFIYDYIERWIVKSNFEIQMGSKDSFEEVSNLSSSKDRNTEMD